MSENATEIAFEIIRSTKTVERLFRDYLEVNTTITTSYSVMVTGIAPVPMSINGRDRGAISHINVSVIARNGTPSRLIVSTQATRDNQNWGYPVGWANDDIDRRTVLPEYGEPNWPLTYIPDDLAAVVAGLFGRRGVDLNVAFPNVARD